MGSELRSLLAEEGVRLVAAYPEQEVPGVAAVSHFGLRFLEPEKYMFMFEKRDMPSV